MSSVDRILIGAVILIVAVAAFFAVRRKKRGGCCGDCAACAERGFCEDPQKKADK